MSDRSRGHEVRIDNAHARHAYSFWQFYLQSVTAWSLSQQFLTFRDHLHIFVGQSSVSVSVSVLANNALRAHHASAHGGVSTNDLS